MAKTTVLLVCVACFLAHGTVSENCTEERTDAFQVIHNLPHTAAAYSSVPDPSLLCMTADLIYFNEAEGILGYSIHLKGLNGTTKKDITYDYRATNDSSVLLLAVNNDTSNLIPSISLYSDFQTCSVFKYIESPERKHVIFCAITLRTALFGCVLYVNRDAVDNIPPICIEKLECACGAAIPLYEKSLCNITDVSA
ncbi:uncharacterized protein LOC144097883 [Amblyomma americanum]